MKYTIRIDAKDGEYEDSVDSTKNRLLKFLEEGKRYTAYMIYREIAAKTEKLHYQGVIEVDSKDAGWHRTRWCETFQDYGKGKKSSAIMKKCNYEIYITKDKDRICSKGYTDEFIKELEDLSYQKEPKEKKDYYDRFWTYICGYAHKTDTWKYDRYYIAERLVDFFGMEKQEIKNFQFYRSLVFNIQARLLYDTEDSKERRNAKMDLVNKIME